MKPNCYQCIHRSKATGSPHSCCNHPLTAKDLENPFASILAVYASIGIVEPIVSDSAKELNVQLNEHGIINNWCNWPWDYDPIWVNACKGYEEVKCPKATLDSSEG